MTSEPVVSVVMPVFNRESLVQSAIRSIQDQTFQDWEMIILDDSSTDRSLEICRAIAEKDPRIRVFANQQNEGVASCRNRLATMARGRYIAHQDSDDLSVPERLEWQVDVLDSMPQVGLVSGICEWVDLHGKTIAHSPLLLTEGGQYPDNQPEMVRLLYRHCNVENATCMVRRSILSEIPGPFDTSLKLCSDWRFLLDLAHHHRIYGIGKVLVKLRRDVNHSHLWMNKQSGAFYADRCLRGVYRDYKNKSSPVSYILFRKAMSGLFLWDAYGWPMPDYQRALQAIKYDPTNSDAWKIVFRDGNFRRSLRFIKHQLLARAANGRN
jgi:glycosyltransferase involved in cell wall biosynthesis